MQNNILTTMKKVFHQSWCVIVLLLLSRVSGMADTISFRNDVMSVINKAGCNAGVCHGKKNGKGGFMLSLRGADPAEDFLALTQGEYGRRLNRIQPDQSFMLLKSLAEISHEGGQRFGRDSEEFRILTEWIQQGCHDDQDAAPRLESITVEPTEILLEEPNWTVQLDVAAYFADGRALDVAHMAVYETSDPSVEVTHDGHISGKKTGESTIIVRYLDKQVPVRVTFVRDVPDFVFDAPEIRNRIDEIVFRKLETTKIPLSPLCSDEVFIRRVYLDLLGEIPSADQLLAFRNSNDPDKRAKCLDELLERPEFADYWALKWSDLFRLEERTLDRKGMHLFINGFVISCWKILPWMFGGVIF